MCFPRTCFATVVEAKHGNLKLHEEWLGGRLSDASSSELFSSAISLLLSSRT